jgi:WD40 repeat protein
MKKINLVKIAMMASFFSWLIGCSSRSVLDFQPLEPIANWQLPESADTVKISPDGQLLAVSTGTAGIKIIDGFEYGGRTKLELRKVADGSLIGTLDAFAVSSIAISHDNSLIATGSYYGYLKIYDLKTGKVLRSIDVPKKDPKRCIRAIHNKPCQIANLIFSPNNQYLISYIGNQGTDVWQVEEGKQLYRLEKGMYGISPDSKLIAFSSKPIVLRRLSDMTFKEKSIQVYRLSDGQVVRELKRIGTPKFSPDGQLIAIYEDYSRSIFLYSLEEDTVKQELNISGEELEGLEFSPDGKYLAVATYVEAKGGGDFFVATHQPASTSSRSGITLYRTDNLSKRKLFFPTSGNRLRSNPLSFSEDGKTFVFADSERNVYLWDISDF